MRLRYRISFGLICGVLAAILTAILAAFYGWPNIVAIPVVVFMAIVISILLPRLVKKRLIATLKWIAVIFTCIGVLILFLSYFPNLWDNVKWDSTIVGLGVGIIGLAIATIALSISYEAGERQQAMANLQFYAKIADIENYIDAVKSGESVVFEAIYNDIKGAMQLNRYVSTDVRQKLYAKINELIDTSLQGKPYADLVRRFQELLQDDS